MEVIRILHSWTRWIVILLALVAIAYYAYALAQSKGWDKRAQQLMTAFSSLIGLQWLIGIVLVIVYAIQSQGIGGYIWGHLVLQTIAMGVAHMHFSWRKRNLPDNIHFRNAIILIVGVFVLIFAGIMALPSGIQWRFYSGV